jgi:Domain of unknown function (DUF4838)
MKRVVLCFVLCFSVVSFGGNLFKFKDLSKKGAWGGIPNRPAGTGEIKVENEILTLTRKKAGGDFKFYRGVTNLSPNSEYRFLCKVKKEGTGAAKFRVIYFWKDAASGKRKWKVIKKRKFLKGETWENVEVTFKVPENSEMIVFQFFPPPTIKSSISITQLTLLPSSDKLLPAEILKSVTKVKKKYKPVGKNPQSTLSLPLYVEKNLLMNGNFTQKQFNIDVPRFWQHAYRKDTIKDRNLYSFSKGVFTLKSPFHITQTIDITQEIPITYTLSFSALIKSGKITCSVAYRSLVDQRDYGITTKAFSMNTKKRKYTFTFNVKPQYNAGSLIIRFIPRNGSTELYGVRLVAQRTEALGKKKEICIDNNNTMQSVLGICVSSTASYYELKAAKYLQKYLFLASNKYLNIYIATKNDIMKKGLIFIGDEFINKEQKNKLKFGGYLVNSNKGTVCIGGGKDDDDGIIQGVFAALRILGFSFYTEKDFELPVDEIICMPKLTYNKNPAFQIRFAPGTDRTSFDATGYSDYKLIDSPRRLGRWMLDIHTAPYLVDPTIYFKEHPEYYAMNKTGKRKWPVRGQVDIHLCMSNSNVQKIAINKMLKWIEAEPETKLFFVSPGDGNGWCQCPKCRKWDTAGSDPSIGRLTDRNIRFVNIIANEVAKKYPDKLIATLAYCGCRKPPLKTKLAPNVIVFYCPYPPSWRCWRHMNCQENIEGIKELAGWIRQYPGQVYIFDYPMGSNIPKGDFYCFVQKIRQYTAFDVKGIYFCGHGSFKEEFNYVIGKMLWTPNLDVEAKIDKFMKFYYGLKAFPFIRKYFNLVNEKELARTIHRYDQGSALVDHELFAKGKSLLDKAIALAKENKSKGLDALYKQKLKLLTEYLQNNNKASGLKGKDLKDYALNLAELLKLYKKFRISFPSYRVSVRDMIIRGAMIDIGKVKPWYKSVIVCKLIKNPVPMIMENTCSYNKTSSGLKFDMPMITGGDELKKYQYNNVPKTIRPFAKVLRRKSSPYSKLNTVFELDKVPNQDVTLVIEGLDDEKKGKASFDVIINGKTLFSGKNLFSENDWSKIKIKVPSKLLKKGENILIVQNTTKDKIAVSKFVEAEAHRQDYNWGWFMISKIELIGEF